MSNDLKAKLQRIRRCAHYNGRVIPDSSAPARE